MRAVMLLIDSANGIYIPRDFVTDFDLTRWGLDPESWEVRTCAAGPEEDGYWDAWEQILNTAEYKKDENVWTLHQDGDLWALCYELMTDEEKQGFGFDEF